MWESMAEHSSRRVAIIPTRFLWPWEFLEVDIEDTKEEPQGVARYLLVVVPDRASKVLFAYPLPTKRALGVARQLLDLVPTFRMPLPIRSEEGDSSWHRLCSICING